MNRQTALHQLQLSAPASSRDPELFAWLATASSSSGQTFNSVGGVSHVRQHCTNMSDWQ